MTKVRREDKLPLKLKQLGKIYRLIEQFEEISRIDLSKLSRLAPATITALTRKLIEENLIIERAVRNTETRGRPAVGLCVSPFYWQSLCAILFEDRFNILLYGLDGSLLQQIDYPLTEADLTRLDQVLLQCLKQFTLQIKPQLNHPITFSIAVVGELDRRTNKLCRLGQTRLELDLKALFEPHFNIPVLVTEYFQDWLLAEGTLGSVIGCDNVLFVQLDDVINLNVLSQGKILYDKSRMNIDRMIVPKLSALQDGLHPNLPEVTRYQASRQITHDAIYQLTDQFYPNNALPNNAEKIQFLCQKAQQGERPAIDILYHIADVLAYLLMNLVNLFASQKIMLSTSLLTAKDIFLPRLNARLSDYLKPYKHKSEVIVSQYDWKSPIVITAAVKQGIYDGSLLAHLIQDKR
ncbi:ROK family protein [Necropsobacter massiliensis]|uniref:ROK family protein n=1 Tax=Necropsobacter massiliensis TaxID=1400001 RepID=UPI000595E9B6|nr:ROK family protein [Necropsobacter massiliensis]